MIVVDKLNKKILKLEKKLQFMNQVKSQQEVFISPADCSLTRKFV